MIHVYLLIAASATSLFWALYELWQALQLPVVRKIDPDYPSQSGVRAPKRPPNGSLDAFATPEIDGSNISRIP
ncbi:hypothetical protein RIVM261_033930 [Rivularia sp. IAM M-261]|nr:hypothetical protein CAL7716_093990 [Calothrix sp. PCC 7716]GJD18437.1 hypothetical protein RIVM261_033930 [Rivularia sp. IAM M-261]